MMLRHKILLFSAGCLILLLFILFSYLVHKDVMTTLDFNTTVRLQDHLPRRVDVIFSFFSFLGNFEIMSFFLLLFLLSLRKWSGIFVMGLYGVFHLVEIFGKYFVNHPPPPYFMLRTLHSISMPQFYVSTEFSYPSGHSGRTMFMAVLLFTLLWKKNLPPFLKIILSTALIGYIVIMMVSRIYLGEHWLSDVIGGGLLGIAFGLLSSSLIVGSKKFKN